MDRRFLSLVLLGFTIYLGVSIPFPVLAILFLQGEHFDPFLGMSRASLLGFALAAYPLGRFCAAALLGYASDRYGRKRVFMLATGMSIFGHLSSYFAIVHGHFLAFLGARYFTGFWEGNIAIARAAATDMTGKGTKTAKFAYLNSAISASYILGPILGALASKSNWGIDLGYQHAFLLASGTSSLSLLLAVFALSETRAIEARGQMISKPRFERPQAALIFLAVSCFFFTLSFDTFFQFFPAYLVGQWQYDSSKIAQAFTVLTVSMASTQAILAKFLDRLPLIRTSVMTSIAFIALLVLIMRSQRLEEVFLCLLGFGFCLGLLETVLPVLFSGATDPSQQGRSMGFMMVLRYFGGVFICVLGGLLASFSISLPLSFAMLSLCFAIGFLLQFVHAANKQKAAAYIT